LLPYRVILLGLFDYLNKILINEPLGEYHLFIRVGFYVIIHPMSSIRSFLFLESSVLVPESVGDADSVNGLDSSVCKIEDRSHYDFPDTSGTIILRVYSEKPGAEIPPGWRAVPIRGVVASVAGLSPSKRAGELLRAFHLNQWRENTIYCSKCGTPMVDAPDEFARLCPACSRREYPRISPAVIVLVEREDGRALLAHNVKFREGLYSLVAGFVEAGETLEEAVAREVREEVGIEITDIRYRESQPWPFPNSLMLGFRARWKKGEIQSDGVEIQHAQWFSRNALPDIPAPGSVSRALIDEWLTEN
jgi:NAD+ diphosphatase